MRSVLSLGSCLYLLRHPVVALYHGDVVTLALQDSSLQVQIIDEMDVGVGQHRSSGSGPGWRLNWLACQLSCTHTATSTAPASLSNAATSKGQSQLSHSRVLRVSATALPKQGTGPMFPTAAACKRQGQLSRVPQPMRGRDSSAQPLDSNMFQGHSPHQGLPCTL